MNRLQTEWQRLYGAPPHTPDTPDPLTRALVLELANPADWASLGRVWAGVQDELDWPEPAIAVSGKDALQLWFSLQQAVSAAQGREVLERLQQRYLADLPHAARRLRLWPQPDGHQAPAIPAECAPDQWSAFVAPDLAPVFTDTPWLDIPPSLDGQADLLRRLRPIAPSAWAAARQALAAATPPATTHAPPAEALAAASPASPAVAVAAALSPRQFLLSVVNDPQAPLALRIDAAKALLPYSD